MTGDLPCRTFVLACAAERQAILDLYFAAEPDSAVGVEIAGLVAGGADAGALRSIADGILGDAFLTMLYGLAGATSLGGDQQAYRLIDEAGRDISSDPGGDLESYAFENFGGA
jgi:hypothetical protein